MKKIYSIIICIYISPYLTAQNNELDSLKNALQTNISDSLRANALNTLAFNSRATNTVQGLEYGYEAIRVSNKINYKKGLSTAYNNLAIVYKYAGKTDSALANHFKALEIRIAVKDTLSIAISYSGIGNVYTDKGDYIRSISYFLKALKIMEPKKEEQKTLYAGFLNNISIAYYHMQNFKQALNYQKESLKIKKQIPNNSPDIGIAMGNLSGLYMMIHFPDSAVFYNREAIKIAESCKDSVRIGYLLINTGSIYMEQEKYKEALPYFFNSLAIKKRFVDKSGTALVNYNIGKAFQKLKEYDKALFHYDRGLQLAKEVNDLRNIAATSKGLSEVYALFNKYQKAYEYNMVYVQAKDSLLNEESSKQIAEMQTKYDTEKKEKEIELLNKDRELQQTELQKNKAEAKQQKTQRNALTGGFIVMVVFAGVSYRNYRNKRKAHALIEKQKNLVEEKQKEILDSINYAKRIQTAILPPLRLVNEYLPQSFILYKPKDIVAGDFYWLEYKNGKVLFAAADCTGHGVPGALVSVFGNNGLNRSVREYDLTDPGKILDKTREIMISEFEKSDDEVKDGMDISLCSLSGNMLQWAGANNPLWIIRKDSNEVFEIKPDKQPIGKYADESPFTTHAVELNSGDSIYIFTDGYADQFGGDKGKKFKYTQLKELLLSIQHESMEKQKELLNETFETWKGNLEQVDDVCIIGVRV